MSRASGEKRSTTEWPVFDLSYTFNPNECAHARSLDPDEVLLFDPNRTDTLETHWIAAKRGAYVSVEDVR